MDADVAGIQAACQTRKGSGEGKGHDLCSRSSGCRSSAAISLSRMANTARPWRFSSWRGSKAGDDHAEEHVGEVEHLGMFFRPWSLEQLFLKPTSSILFR